MVKNWERLLFGLLVAALGVALLANNLGYVAVDVGPLARTYWPLALVYLGLKSLVMNWRRGLDFGGGVLILLGLLFLGRNLDWFGGQPVWSWFWPALLIWLGLSILVSSTRISYSRQAQSNLLGDANLTPVGVLGSGSYHTLIGDLRLDLTHSTLSPGDTVIRVGSLVGDVQVLVPPGMPVAARGNCGIGDLVLLGKKHSGLFVNGQMESEDFRDADRRLVVLVQSGVGDGLVTRLG